MKYGVDITVPREHTTPAVRGLAVLHHSLQSRDDTCVHVALMLVG